MKQFVILVSAIMFLSVAALTAQEREIVLSENSVNHYLMEFTQRMSD